MPRVIAAIVATPVLCSAAWVSVRAPGVEVLTDAGAGAASSTLRRLSEFEALYRVAEPGAIEGPGLRVVIFARAADFAAHRRGHANAGFYLEAGGHDWIVVENSSPRVLAHEYAHRVRAFSGVRYPPWFEEGLAEFYSTLEFRGGVARAGGLIQGHARVLGGRTWIPMRALLDASAEPEEKADVFYAQSWALVHMLLAAPGYREHVPAFRHLLDERVPPMAALEQAFRKPLGRLEAELRQYVDAQMFQAVTLPYTPPAPVAAPPVRTLSAVEVLLLEGEIHLATGHQLEAQRIYDRLAGTASAGPAGEAALGTLALGRKDFVRARQHLRRALDGGFDSPGLFLEYAMLLRETGGAPHEVRLWLKRAIEREPNLGDAHFLLGIAASVDGKFTEAAAHFARAVRAKPRRGLWWYNLALAQRDAGALAEARTSLYRAMDFAATEQDREAAETLLDSLGRAAQGSRPAKPAVTVPSAWTRPEGDQVAEGRLIHVDCRGASLGLHVEQRGGPLKLLAEKPGEIVIRNTGSVQHEFKCGPASAERVRIRYFARPLEGGYVGSITSIDWAPDSR